MNGTSVVARAIFLARRFWAGLGLSILCAAAQWTVAGPASAQNELCGNGSVDFAQGETCDDGGSCVGGDDEGRMCTTFKRCAAGINQGDVCETEEDCPRSPSDLSCPSDCDGNGTVSVSELITTLDIALALESIDSCLAADPDGDGSVTISDAVLGVDSALVGCPLLCGEPCPGGACVAQDGDLDLEDSCPSTCQINRECADPTPLNVTVRFSAPGDGQLSTGRFFLRYPDQSIRLPGSGTSNAVFNSFSFPWLGTVTPNDLDYAVRVLAVAEPFFTIEADELFTIAFDRCAGTPDPTLEDFRCTVFDAFAVDASNVTDQTTCSVELP